jgi:hypothetical protein
MANIISTTPIAKTKVDFDDRGAFNMFQELVHSWVGYDLVKVLLNFGISPKIWQDLEDWSPDLFNLFPTLATNNGILQKKNTLNISCLFSLIELYITGTLQNCHLDAGTNLQK